MQKQSIIQTILITAVLAGTVMVASAKTDAYLKIRAVEGCMQSAQYRYENKENGIVTTEPNKLPYEKCLKDKGVN